MKENIKDCFPEWWKAIDNERYYLILTNDLDSWLSCLYLAKKFGVDIGGFYDFKSLWVNDKANGKEPIYVDCDLTNGKAFGNHVQGIANKQSINLNIGINQHNYTDKYAGSTLMMLFSLYGESFNYFNEEQIKLLLCVDSWFKQFFKFRKQWDNWVELMDLEFINGIVTQDSIEYYYNTIIEYGLNQNIEINSNGKLMCGIDLEKISHSKGLFINNPNGLVFDKKIKDFNTFNANTNINIPEYINIFSSAMVYRNKISFSYF